MGVCIAGRTRQAQKAKGGVVNIAERAFLHPLQSRAFSPFADRLRQNVDLSKTNWFRVGGPAEWLFKPNDAQDLAAFLSTLPHEIPVTVLGVGSNIIVRDGGIDGVVVKLGRGFVSVHSEAKTIHVGAGMLALNLAHYASEQGISGLEFMCGVPGTVGGMVRMNAGAYDNDIAGVLVKAEIVERDGKIRWLDNKELGFSYRKSGFFPDAIVTAAVFEGRPGDKETISLSMKKITDSREATQPVRTRTGGSTFKNPPGQKAWELIEQAGCRGLEIGGARVSQLHCNFIMNTGKATAADLENLGEEVRKRVLAKTGVDLEWEIKRIGKE
jgi:UDP-N-acetylmuramate dehydrogenase